MNDEKSKRWPVLFLGHDADKDTPGTFVWKLRDELKEACKEYNIEKWLNIAPFDMEEFKKALKAYKKEFNIHIVEEIYKWKAIKQFQAFSIFYRDKRQFLIFCKMNYKDISLLSTVSKILYDQKDFLLRPSVKSCTPKKIFFCVHP
ncbi:hypothetical protein [Treponema porcinum]|uniref:hypothetical protein n=1 Tax=Treponema porcinum TaxID=261392 RepID=UPI002A7FEAF6|nr:hypothetical protein [Treponema porcinum]MDY4467656.1 hypothetical protein [Treponema porcinum]